MHKNGWRPFWAALGAALLVLLPLVLDNSGVALCHYLNQLFKSLCVSGERTFLYIFPAVKRLVSDLSVYTDTLAISLCYDRLILHIYKLILQ